MNRRARRVSMSLDSVSVCLALPLLSFLLAGCSDTPAVVVYTSVDQVFSEPVLRRFEEETGVRVLAVYDTEETKSTGVLNRLIAEAAHPQADVFWSGDPVRPFLLVDRGLVEPYLSPRAQEIPPEFKASDGTWTGFAARARVLLVNRERLGDRIAPRSVRDLIDPQWRGEVAMANPVFGTTTMHVAAWFSVWGEDEARAFLGELRENQILIASSNGEVKRLVAAGEATFGLTDTDDAFMALQSDAPVEVVYPDQDGIGTLVMPTVAVLIHDGPNPDAARRMIDYLLSTGVEESLAGSAAHMPLRAGTPHPDHVRSVAEIRPMAIDYADVARRMEEIQPWLRSWSGL